MIMDCQESFKLGFKYNIYNLIYCLTIIYIYILYIYIYIFIYIYTHIGDENI